MISIGAPRLAFDGEGVLLFGGRTLAPGGFQDHGDTWKLRGDAWILAAPAAATGE